LREAILPYHLFIKKDRKIGAGDGLYQLNEKDEDDKYPHRVHAHPLPPIIPAKRCLIEHKELRPFVLKAVL
jgi:hypothetical protein